MIGPVLPISSARMELVSILVVLSDLKDIIIVNAECAIRPPSSIWAATDKERAATMFLMRDSVSHCIAKVPEVF